MTSKKAKKKAVVVTTDTTRRGVFGGFLVSHEKDVVVLEEARMAVYWSRDVHGILGLAANGPSENCRISPAAPIIKLDGVTAVMDMTDNALVAWRKQPWK